MKRIGILGVLGLLVVMTPSVGLSNAAAPPNLDVPLTIKTDKSTKENRLVIPRRFLPDAGPGRLEGAGPLGTDLRTVIAGLAISVSVVSLVFLIIRKRSRAAQVMALCVVVGSGGVLYVSKARADLPPPTADVARQWGQVAKGDQNVTIEIIDQGDAVELILGTKYRGIGGQRPEPRDFPPDLKRPNETGSAPTAEPKSEPPAPKSDPEPKPE